MYGVDYGAKLAGTTVVAFLSEKDGKMHFAASEKKQDADAFLLDFFAKKERATIFLDAPLSLPAVYASGEFTPGADFFYRACDRALGAMSPMFLGGLTARAMSLAAKLRIAGHRITETYPGALAREWGLKEMGYKGGIAQIPGCIEALKQYRGLPVEAPSVKSWHHFDALLALHSCLRSQNGEDQTLGDVGEGLIVY